jgi:hypothetical protein
MVVGRVGWAPHRRPGAALATGPQGFRGVAFHVLSSAEAALGAGFDLERIGLRGARERPFFNVKNQGVTVCETPL